MLNKRIKSYGIVIIIVSLLLMTLLLEKELGNRIVTIITICTAVIGASFIIIQYKRDKDVNQATFILEYAKYFNSLNKVQETSLYLDEYRLGNKKIVKKINYSGIVNYLFWCEELSTLVQKNIVDIKTIDNLFSYSFFLITNNKYIQDIELCPQAEFYKGIFYLHKEWTKYKKQTKQIIINEEESLNKVKDYELYAKKGDIYNTDTY